MIVLWGDDVVIFAQGFDLSGEVAVGGHQRIEVGAADHLLQILGRGQRLLDAKQVALPLGRGDADLLGQDRLHLGEDPRSRLVAVGNERDDEPTGPAQSPRDGQRQPPESGRASWRERVGKYVYISVVAV